MIGGALSASFEAARLLVPTNGFGGRHHVRSPDVHKYYFAPMLVKFLQACSLRAFILHLNWAIMASMGLLTSLMRLDTAQMMATSVGQTSLCQTAVANGKMNVEQKQHKQHQIPFALHLLPDSDRQKLARNTIHIKNDQTPNSFFCSMAQAQTSCNLKDREWHAAQLPHGSRNTGPKRHPNGGCP